MDGVGPLSDQDTESGEYRDEFACVLAYNLKRVMNILGVKPLIQAMQA